MSIRPSQLLPKEGKILPLLYTLTTVTPLTLTSKHAA